MPDSVTCIHGTITNTVVTDGYDPDCVLCRPFEMNADGEYDAY